MARAFKILTFSATGDGLSQEYTIPDNTRAVALQADGSVYEHGEEGMVGYDYWPIGSGQKESVLGRDQMNEKLYFTGTEGAKLYIIMITGIGA